MFVHFLEGRGHGRCGTFWIDVDPFLNAVIVAAAVGL